jgi:hypothetical protein
MEALVVKISLLILCIVCITSKEDKRTSWKGIFNRVPTSEAAKFVLSRSPIGQDERESLSLCRDIRRRRREFQHYPGVLKATEHHWTVLKPSWTPTQKYSARY